MATETFLQKFEDGELGDSEDFFEWFAIAQAENPKPKHTTEDLTECIVKT